MSDRYLQNEGDLIEESAEQTSLEFQFCSPMRKR